MERVKSMTSARFTVWPVSDVPPPRGSSATCRARATSTAARTSSASRGMTTPSGSTWYMDASVE